MLKGANRINHIDISPNGNKYAFLHRWTYEDKQFHRLLVGDLSSGKLKNIISSSIVSHFYWKGDIRSYHIVRDAVDGVDYILHLAALPSVPRSVKDPITSNEVNVVGTLNILNAAKEA
ncbi:MAG: NAD-dependent epimerase/dehydratase family protein, partial [Candidatus Lokiarchaeota archaeon]|nr:NAD-dependent epimerase/dehydratase family protein [Candidatus Lokiarchaeota archaeon]